MLRDEGYRVVLVNSNPATIMTDPEFADATYVEPLDVATLARIIERERPDALLPTLGGQTGAQPRDRARTRPACSTQYGVELIGASVEAIRTAEDRSRFKAAMSEIGLARAARRASRTRSTKRCAVAERGRLPGDHAARRSSSAAAAPASRTTPTRCARVAAHGLAASPVVGDPASSSRSSGWKEYELEVMRDHADNVVVICSIENFDPMGVHTGDSITVAPAQTLTDVEYQRMRDAAFACIRRIGVDTGGSNIQFAVEPAQRRAWSSSR